MKESIPVIIFGQSLNLRSNSSPEEVLRVADFVNQAIADVATNTRVADSLHVALLAFLNVAQSYLQLQGVNQGEQQELVSRLNHMVKTIEAEMGHD